MKPKIPETNPHILIDLYGIPILVQSIYIVHFTLCHMMDKWYHFLCWEPIRFVMWSFLCECWILIIEAHNSGPSLTLIYFKSALLCIALSKNTLIQQSVLPVLTEYRSSEIIRCSKYFVGGTEPRKFLTWKFLSNELIYETNFSL